MRSSSFHRVLSTFQKLTGNRVPENTPKHLKKIQLIKYTMKRNIAFKKIWKCQWLHRKTVWDSLLPRLLMKQRFLIQPVLCGTKQVLQCTTTWSLGYLCSLHFCISITSNEAGQPWTNMCWTVYLVREFYLLSAQKCTNKASLTWMKGYCEESSPLWNILNLQGFYSVYMIMEIWSLSTIPTTWYILKKTSAPKGTKGRSWEPSLWSLSGWLLPPS